MIEIAYQRQFWLFKTKTHTVCRGWNRTMSPLGIDPAAILLVIVPNEGKTPAVITPDEAIKPTPVA